MTQDEIRAALLEAALPHVSFDGWSEATLSAAIRDSGLEAARARLACPRGAVDLAVAYHEAGDRALAAWLAGTDLGAMRYSDRVAAAVRHRLELADPELVRHGAALMALPHLAPLGLRLVWGTADVIWTGLGDASRDANWYSKRAILSSVYSATVLYWMGDDSPGKRDSWRFLDQRIAGVMRFEKTKRAVTGNPILSRVLAGPLWLAGQLRAPAPRDDLPGRSAR